MMSSVPLGILCAATLLVVLASIEGGFRLGHVALTRSEEEKESPVSAIVGTILGLLAFMMAFTFAIVSDRYDARKALVREEAGVIRTAWTRSDFLPEPDRSEAARLLREYVDGRLAAVASGDMKQFNDSLASAVRIQFRLWDMAVTNARKDMNSDVAALYIESLNDLINIHAMRVSIGVHTRIPSGIWLSFYAFIILGMVGVGYHAAIASSRRSVMMLVLGLSFTLVITLISALDRSQSYYFPVPQQPLQEVRLMMDAHAETSPR